MSLTMLTAIKEKHPHANITWICGSIAAPLVQATDLVENLLIVDEVRLFRGTFFQKALEIFSLWKQIGGVRFDLCLTAHSDPKYRILSLPILCKEKRFWGQKSSRNNPIQGRSHAQEYARLFHQIDGPTAQEVKLPALHLPRSEKIEALKKTYADLPWIAIAPGGAKNVLAEQALRRWSVASYKLLLQKLSPYPFHLFVTGSSEDFWLRKDLEEVSCHDLIGELDLLELVLFFQKCSLLITHDSGSLHLAKLANCKTLALFGPVNPKERISSSDDITVLWGGESLPCRPCYDGKCFALCQNNLCLSSITPDSVLEKALELYSKIFTKI